MSYRVQNLIGLLAVAAILLINALAR